jgi:hypothetical protein
MIESGISSSLRDTSACQKTQTKSDPIADECQGAMG